MFITKDILYAGVNDHQVDLFEGQYPVPNGMAYNSYVILDEKIAVMDTVDAALLSSGWTIWPAVWTAGSRTIWWCSTWSPTTPPTSPALLSALPGRDRGGQRQGFAMMRQFLTDLDVPAHAWCKEGDPFPWASIR